MLKRFLYILLLLLVNRAGSQTLVFKNYSVNHGLASSTVYSTHQDSKGFIWFATENGVNRFDGKNFELFTIDNGLSDNEVLHIDEDSKGRIWFLTLNGKLCYYQDKKFHNTVNDALLKKTICKASFSSFYEDSKHRLWFSTNQNKLLEINGDQVKFHSSAFTLANISLFENRYGNLMGLTKTHLLTLNKGKFLHQPIAELPVSPKSIVYNSVTHNLKYVSESGLISLKDNYTNTLRYFPEEINSHTIGKFLTDRKNDLWVSTMGNGVYIFKPGSSSGDHYLKENIITDIKQDRQGNIWITTIGNGVFMLPSYSQSSLNYTTADGLSSNSVHSVIKEGNRIIVGLRNGNINIIEKDKIYQYLSSSDYNPIKKLHYDQRNQSLWFASDHKLGELTTKSRKENILQELCGGSYALKSFSMGSKGELALAMASGVYVTNQQKPLIFESKKPLNNNNQLLTRSFTVFYDSADRLWLANLNGLFCYHKNVLLFSNNEIRCQRITDIKELPDGRILCSTVGFGVILIKNLKKQSTITRNDGLSSNICKKIFVKDNNAWVVTGKGISKINFGKTCSIRNYNTENGLISSEVNDLYVANDTIYAATNSGLSIIADRTIAIDAEAPPLYINQFLSNKKPVDLEKEIILPYRGNNITVNYIGLDYEHPQSVKYSYKLNPEFKWIETSSNILEFASLQPGTYHLQVRAKCLNSDWSDPQEVQFTIDPPFWKTWWFILITIALLAYLLFYLVNRYYKSKRAKETERLLTRTKIISLEQQALQAMMNPHFVFNVMNSIQYFINTKDNAMANQALTGFARLLRKNLENCNKSYITLEEEISYLNLYLSLEKMRFGERMNYTIAVDKHINKEVTYIPSMLLQPYVENAIWHGLMPKDDNGSLSINIHQKTALLLEIEIKDDGIGIENSLQHKPEGHISRGMQLTNERIRLLSKFKDQPIRVEVKQMEPEGTCVTIQIPL